jgi:hypothetical protein
MTKQRRQLRANNAGMIYRRAIMDISRIVDDVAKACEDEDTGHYLRMKKTRIFRGLLDAMACIVQCEPQDPCPTCNGDGCPKCHGTGFHTKGGGE